MNRIQQETIYKTSETNVFLENRENTEIFNTTNPVYYEYLVGYNLLAVFLSLFFSMYVLDFYFINKVIVIRNLEHIMIHMPLWLLVNGVAGVTFLLTSFVYHLFHFYEEIYNKNMFKGFYVTFLVYSMFFISWTVIGWLLFVRYPTLPSTEFNPFHVKMWIHLSLQSVVCVYTFFRFILLLKNI